jgi:hypothetical protein
MIAVVWHKQIGGEACALTILTDHLVDTHIPRIPNFLHMIFFFWHENKIIKYLSFMWKICPG